MKTFLSSLALSLLGTLAGLTTNATDFLPPSSVCALGRIAELQPTGPNRWRVRLEGVEVLLFNPPAASTGATANPKPPSAKWSVTLPTGLGGVLVTPTNDWIGQFALVHALEDNGAYTVPNTAFALSPNGAAFAVLAADQTKEIQSIRNGAGLLAAPASPERAKRLAALVETPAEPLFLKCLAVEEVARSGLSVSDATAATRARLTEWRENPKFPAKLRLCADEALVNLSPRSDQWSEARLNFLTQLRDQPDAPADLRGQISQRLAEAVRMKSPQAK